MNCFVSQLLTPIGPLSLFANDRALLSIEFSPIRKPKARFLQAKEVARHDLLSAARTQIEQYFEGERTLFTLPIEADGTEFQREVWSALQTIRFGETVSYAELAIRVGRPKAVRAVGSANRANPLAILIPCHRVISKTGAIGGYAGGLPAKNFLLTLERRLSQSRAVA